MILTKKHDAKFHKVLEAEQLADIAQFFAPDVCDEVPLYSRYKQISFLSEMGTEQANRALLTFGLQFLDGIISSHPGNTEFFAALTIWEVEYDELLVPAIFICNRPKVELKKLVLNEVTSCFSKSIRELVANIPGGDKYQVMEDPQTIKDSTRVFISWAVAPCPQFKTLCSYS